MPKQTQTRQQRKQSTTKKGNGKKRTNKKKTNKKKQTGLWKKIILGIIALGFIALLAGAGLFAYYAANAPEVNREALEDTEPSKLLALDGSIATEV